MGGVELERGLGREMSGLLSGVRGFCCLIVGVCMGLGLDVLPWYRDGYGKWRHLRGVGGGGVCSEKWGQSCCRVQTEVVKF